MFKIGSDMFRKVVDTTKVHTNWCFGPLGTQILSFIVILGFLHFALKNAVFLGSEMPQVAQNRHVVGGTVPKSPKTQSY